MIDQEEVLKKYPRIVSHLICESLGYFTPKAAANAIIAYKLSKPFSCEWYCHIAQCANDRDLVSIGKDVLKHSIMNRKFHKGFMANYPSARAIVQESVKGRDPVFASWF